MLDTDANAEHSFSEFCTLLCVAKIYDVNSKPSDSSKAKKEKAKETDSTAKTVATRKPKGKGLLLLNTELLKANRKSDAQVSSQRTRANFTRETRTFVISTFDVKAACL